MPAVRRSIASKYDG